jgi:hypothetical protein
MLNWVLQHRVELTAIAWLGNILLCAPFVYMALSSFRYRRQFRRQLRMSAVVQARYSVFDSWIRSGGAINVLGENVRSSILEDYRTQARKHGDEYFALFETSTQDAERDLKAVVKLIKGASNDEQEKD